MIDWSPVSLENQKYMSSSGTSWIIYWNELTLDQTINASNCTVKSLPVKKNRPENAFTSLWQPHLLRRLEKPHNLTRKRNPMIWHWFGVSSFIGSETQNIKFFPNTRKPTRKHCYSFIGMDMAVCWCSLHIKVPFSTYDGYKKLQTLLWVENCSPLQIIIRYIFCLHVQCR